MANHEVESEVQGNVWKIEVTEGQQVAQGEVLLILESMKMEIPVEAPVAGVVAEILVKLEDSVDEEQVLVLIHAGES
jgi:acetyl-CoA carboxylase biotin carboxyl carrier protein